MEFVGVIVTYNRKELLMKNLSMLSIQAEQLNRVIIVDNHSTDGTQELVMKECGNNPNWIDYVYMDENTGGAGGFYYGVKYAYETGADFIYLMDDDGYPFDKYTIKNVKRETNKLYENNKLLFINSLVTTDGVHLSFGFWTTIDRDRQIEKIKKQSNGNLLFGKVNPFNGTLVSRELVKKIGYPRKEFFLSRDETDYVRRSEAAGATVATVLDSVYCHPSSKLVCKKIGSYAVQIYPDLDKEYYYLRNAVFTYKENNKKKVIGICIIRLITILMYEDMKFARIRQIKVAVSDAINGRMGKRTAK